MTGGHELALRVSGKGQRSKAALTSSRPLKLMLSLALKPQGRQYRSLYLFIQETIATPHRHLSNFFLQKHLSPGEVETRSVSG
jgi:hypothetical protein